ncbi:MAG TPA: hypothetical protein VF544_08115 [Pyrinomonadaceae bacterium]|jgi:site-specific recombinase XerD
MQEINKKRSYARDEQIADVLCDFFKGQTLRSIKKSDVEKLKMKRSESLTKYDRKSSPATVNRELSVLSAILTLAVDDELIPSNPCRKVKQLRMDNTRNRYLSRDEEIRLLAALEGEEWLRNKDRTVPMNMTIREMLERQPRTSGYVFPSPRTGG